MADFASIQARVNSRLIDLPSAIVTEVPLLVNQAIRQAEQKHNFRIMEAEQAISTVIAVRTLTPAIASDFKEKRAKPFYRDGQDGLLSTEIIDWAASKEDMLKRYELDDTTSDGSPRFILVDDAGVNYSVWPFPDGSSQWDDGEYRLVMPYWKFLPDLTGTQTNWFTANMEEYLIYQATGNGFMVNWDEIRAAGWFTLATDRFNNGKRHDKLSRIERNIAIVPKLDAGAPSPRRG